MKMFLSLMGACLVVAPAHAQTRDWTPQNLVQEALHKNPEIRFYEAEIEAARAGRLSAARLSDPVLSMETGAMSIAGQTDGAVWRAEIAQVFDFPGRLALRKAIADQDITLAELGLEQCKSQLGNQVRALAGDVVLLRRKEAAARSVQERLRSLIEVLVQRDTGAVSALLERRILEAALLTSTRTLTEAAKEADAASAGLAVLCGLAPEERLNLADADTAFPEARSLQTLKQQAAKTNFGLQQKRLEVAKQGLKVDLTKTERWGDITFGPYMAGQHAGGTQIEGGVVFSIPLPLWGKNKGQVAAEKARAQQAEALLAAALRDLERDLAVSRSAYVAELSALSQWRPESEKEFRDAATEADRHFRLGAVPAATYVEMQRGYLEAMDALIESRRSAWKHRMELERLIGSPMKADEGRSAKAVVQQN
ncbi:outer membrane protein, cobalt-zinc-cadmium efflux system [Prosthecobacter debontii]|uniref:Outer membrane protein, cobalt-zinc-cadmium efflux system n=1 Tax=Prosthecobacter debontii TaxID=48467 RepID=A0A1T4Y630_9BACT|nr:TolC family protein [Prosthecobacter debontii]SKA97170.1 outer membrane protein, cobalt-zinc-cadmium efflux system [Prosthecobacter debontii]